MPVLIKATHKQYMTQLTERYRELLAAFEPRALLSGREGAGKGLWANPEAMCATVGASLRLRLAVEDFETILKEIKKLK